LKAPNAPVSLFDDGAGGDKGAILVFRRHGRKLHIRKPAVDHDHFRSALNDRTQFGTRIANRADDESLYLARLEMRQ
jgi:hypothetical protein